AVAPRANRWEGRARWVRRRRDRARSADHRRRGCVRRDDEPPPVPQRPLVRRHARRAQADVGHAVRRPGRRRVLRGRVHRRDRPRPAGSRARREPAGASREVCQLTGAPARLPNAGRHRTPPTTACRIRWHRGRPAARRRFVHPILVRIPTSRSSRRYPCGDPFAYFFTDRDGGYSVYEGLMVSVSGVRGRVGEALTPEMVTRFAAGFGAWAKAKWSAGPRGSGRCRVVVGRDSRVSGPMFHRATIAALQSVGCDVIDVGLAPTPSIQLAVEHHHAAGGLAITASHNPIEWNALKFIGPSGLFLDGAEGTEMRGVVESAIPRATWDRLGEVESDDNAIERHLDAVLSLPFVKVDAIRTRKFRVAVDCAHGAGGAIIPELLSRLGCDVHAINLETDGRFTRSPEPVASNLGDLERLVLETKAEVGLATDPDVDRLALVSDQGAAIGEDWTLALAARLVLRYRRGPVVANLSTSRIVDDVAKEAGAAVVRAPVGEVNVA